ncbi:MAG: 3-methyl-2-oxobutanoate dehydrogenase subunit VorB [Candidatus Aureabacteria bacterium]|jgi:2-oxoglutarate ferredoxin oxidoreductase subunit alpha|nr:3-methyl-2-oxobutanoate dehydrogenase subunit VorB [Candidatus Auribacterota bacterium]
MAKKKLMCGNEALSEAAIAAGCRCYFGYPITPQNEVTSYMSRRMPEVGGQFVQSESELAAINMVFGASAVGARAITSSSSPGISLMQEGISYIAGCELPAVIVNIMRGGPGLGNIGPSQADYFQATRGGGHGDYHVIVLAPASVQELVDHVFLAFDLADRYRNPVMILGDGVLGQMVEPVEIPARRHARLPAKGWALTGCAGREPNKVRSLVLGDNELLAHNQKLQARYRQIAEAEMRQESFETDGAELLLVSYGTPSRTCRAALKGFRARGYRVGLFRPVTLWPFPAAALAEAAKAARVVLVVEMSAGQLIEDVRLSLGRSPVPVELLGKPGGEVIQKAEVNAAIEKVVEAHGLKRR